MIVIPHVMIWTNLAWHGILRFQRFLDFAQSIIWVVDSVHSTWRQTVGKTHDLIGVISLPLYCRLKACYPEVHFGSLAWFKITLRCRSTFSCVTILLSQELLSMQDKIISICNVPLQVVYVSMMTCRYEDISYADATNRTDVRQHKVWKIRWDYFLQRFLQLQGAPFRWQNCLAIGLRDALHAIFTATK